MSGAEPIIIPQGDLPKLVAVIAEHVAEDVASRLRIAALPTYYKFPEDIITMTGEHIPVGTILSWKTLGYLRTFKIGRRAFVRPEDWQWFLDNNAELMAAAPNNRKAKLVKGRN